jgi:hypothetical protein
VRRGKYKFIRIQDRAFVRVRKPPGKIPGDWNQLPTEELFDLESDPGETNNLTEDLPAVTTQMARLLDEIEEINAGAPAEPTGVDEALQKRLRALGYIR